MRKDADCTTDLAGGTSAAAAALRSPRAVRARCHELLELAREERLEHFALDESRLGPTARLVAECTRAAYPDLDIPMHSRWRHFEVRGQDRRERLSARLASASTAERARASIDLVVVSVLLDAGAGAAWRYRDASSGAQHARSEGLALASYDLFASGALSARGDDPLRADAQLLAGIDARALAEAFQVSEGNPLVGLEGRAALLRRLAVALAADADRFGAREPRLGHLFDHLAARAAGGALPAEEILGAVLAGLAPIWPERTMLAGENLGDVWRHPAVVRDDETNGLVPFHKLSQWLAYSLVEPLQEAGVAVTGLDALTGLAEYRNGGLLVDLGVLRPRDARFAERTHPVDCELVVEWRALTVACLDLLLPPVRAELDLPQLTLAQMLEGGTWRAGRRAAGERRADGGAPIRVLSDGTVF